MPYNVLAKPSTYFGIHNHTDRSNFRLKDCINKVTSLIDYAVEIGLAGIAITDHEVLAAHVEAIQYVKEQKEKGNIPQDFKLGLGNEIYLVDRDEAENCKENNLPMKFYHFLLLAKNRRGYEGLKKLSSMAWDNSYFFRGMERVPTYKDDLNEVMKEYKGDIIASTACVGSEFAQTILKWVREDNMEAKKHIHRLVTWYKNMFGEDFYIELQPSFQDDQTDYNKAARTIAKAYSVKTIVATDAHYLNKDQAFIHETYLKADEGEREVADFYSTTYIMSPQELEPFFEPYFEQDYLEEMKSNTLEIIKRLEDFDLAHEVIVPPVKVPEFELQHLFEPYYEQYEYIRKYAHSSNIEDRYHLYNIEQGFIKYKQKFNDENIARINEEYKELWLTSEKLGQPVSSYYLLTQKVVDIMWEVSLVGVSRGSAASWYTVYLLGITQINPIKYNLPHWRHLTHERPEMPDIDIDSEASQRANILELMKQEFGWENVLNISTLTKEKTRSAILTGCRGMGIDNDVAQNIANLIPTDKTGMWTLRECLEGNEEQGKKPVKELVEEFEQYPGLLETIEAIEGLVSGRSVHASGIYIFRDGYLPQNAMMKTTGGQYVTQFNMQDSDYMGGLKMDALTINALDRIRANMELLLEAGKIEWQGNLRATYEKYLHPDVLDMEDPEMFKLLYEGEIFDAFQFDSAVGSQAVQKIKPQTFQELSSGNSLMRLSPDGGESPLDRFVRHKANIQEWYDEMAKAGLSPNEIKLVRDHLDPLYGVADTQEIMMIMSMDPNISDFGLLEANKLRKGVAKKSKKVIEECWDMFQKGCERTGCSDALRDYVWNSCFKPQFGYSFSLPHIAGYTMILMQELNLAAKYGVIYWKTACLTVNSGLIGEREGNTNYGAVAKAVGDMRGTVLNPDINRSKLGFTPLEDEDKILFGLKPISGLGKDAVKVIMEKRPFTSLEDFVERAIVGLPDQVDEEGNVIFKDKTMSDKKGVVVIKSGCFDSLYPDTTRRDLMVEYVRLVSPKKDKLTMSNLPHVIDNVPAELSDELSTYNFRNMIFGRNKVAMTKDIEKVFLEKYSSQVEYKFNDGKLAIDQKSFDKVYKKQIEPLRQWVISPEAATIFNKKKMREFWQDNCMGLVEQWEMETVVFYSDKHELDYVPLEQYFDVVNFFDLKPSNIVEWKQWGKRRFPRYELGIIAGTVVDKNKDKHIVYLSTQYGVVPVKYHKGAFLHYDKKVVNVKGEVKEVIDPSWFTRGTRLVIVGYRRGDEFVPKVYKDTAYAHTTMQITSYNQNNVNLLMEKRRV
jgi:DNA polymerase III subunit alpha